tara:strand:+ start:387 stop:560 length:174 start_codon:yes stop_codon:yes gene_type:complete
VGAEVSVMLEGWCNVFHHSTEYFITGILKEPTIAIKQVIMLAVLKFSINFQIKIYVR